VKFRLTTLISSHLVTSKEVCHHSNLEYFLSIKLLKIRPQALKIRKRDTTHYLSLFY